MAKIRVLDEATVNMIAAGEVIERPASVLKELLENSLDAGATSISVTIEDGGKGLVAVVDDGCGMSAQDLALAFEPHATSKVRTAQDLLRIGTFGFRGEALASIAAVCRVRAVSRTRHACEAYCIEIDCGQKGPVVPCSGNVGTAVYARDIFYRFPARQKFLRSAQTEMDHIVEQFIRVALGLYTGKDEGPWDPELTLTHNGRLVYRLTRDQYLHARIAQLFPFLAEKEGFTTVHYDADGLRVDGLLGLPHLARPSARLQYVFLNGRFIRDRGICHAVRQAYKGLIDPQRHAVVFLFVQMDPSWFDVNVHPTKIEVRFYKAGWIHDRIQHCIAQALHAVDLAAPLRIGARAYPQGPAVSGSAQGSIMQAVEDFLDGRSKAAGQVRQPYPRYIPATNAGDQIRPAFLQIHDSYIVLQTDDGLEIVDQHALHEMVLYDTICRRLAQSGLESQRLLLCPEVQLDSRQVRLLQDHADLLGRLGLEVESCGGQEYRICAFPGILSGADPVQFFLDLLDLLEDNARLGPEGIAEAAAAMGACRGAVKAGQRLSDEEIGRLLVQGLSGGSIKRCPHGRPASLRLTLQDLARQFGRD